MKRGSSFESLRTIQDYQAPRIGVALDFYDDVISQMPYRCFT
jgi:hypothetical protein